MFIRYIKCLFGFHRETRIAYKKYDGHKLSEQVEVCNDPLKESQMSIKTNEELAREYLAELNPKDALVSTTVAMNLWHMGREAGYAAGLESPEVKGLVEALKYYADHKSWTYTNNDHDGQFRDYTTIIGDLEMLVGGGFGTS